MFFIVADERDAIKAKSLCKFVSGFSSFKVKSQNKFISYVSQSKNIIFI